MHFNFAILLVYMYSVFAHITWFSIFVFWHCRWCAAVHVCSIPYFFQGCLLQNQPFLCFCKPEACSTRSYPFSIKLQVLPATWWNHSL